MTTTATDADTAARPPIEITSLTLGMPATKRCDRCGAQAFYEVETYIEQGDEGVRGELLFCAHHATIQEAALKESPAVVRIFDHRPALVNMERAFKGQPA